MIEYRNLRRTVKNRTKNEFKLYRQNIENNLKKDPSSFWIYTRAKSKQNGIPQVMNIGNNSFGELQYIADAFAQFFSSVFKKFLLVGENRCYKADFVFSIVTKKNSVSQKKYVS